MSATTTELYPPRETIDLHYGDRIRTLKPAPGFGVHEQIPAGERAEVLDVLLNRDWKPVVQVRFYKYHVIRNLPLADVQKI